MKIKLLKYKGVPISPIVLFKTILNDENKTLDKVLNVLENNIKNLKNSLNSLNSKINDINSKINDINSKINDINSKYNNIYAKAYEYIKRTDIVYIDDVLTYDYNPNKSYNFKEITKVGFDNNYPYIYLDDGNYLSISLIENMSDYTFEPSDPINSNYFSYIKQKSTGTYVIGIGTYSPHYTIYIKRLISTDDIIHRFKLKDSKTGRSIEIIF